MKHLTFRNKHSCLKFVVFCQEVMKGVFRLSWDSCNRGGCFLSEMYCCKHLPCLVLFWFMQTSKSFPPTPSPQNNPTYTTSLTSWHQQFRAGSGKLDPVCHIPLLPAHEPRMFFYTVEKRESCFTTCKNEHEVQTEGSSITFSWNTASPLVLRSGLWLVLDLSRNRDPMAHKA